VCECAVCAAEINNENSFSFQFLQHQRQQQQAGKLAAAAEAAKKELQQLFHNEFRLNESENRSSGKCFKLWIFFVHCIAIRNDDETRMNEKVAKVRDENLVLQKNFCYNFTIITQQILRAGDKMKLSNQIACSVDY